MSKFSLFILFGTFIILAYMPTKAESSEITVEPNLPYAKNIEQQNKLQLTKDKFRTQSTVRLLKEKKDYKKACIAFLVLFIIVFIVLIVLIILFLRY